MITEKQKKAVENMVENGGIVSKAMRDAGYSEATAKTPQKLTESKGFEELCEQCGLTDDLILKSLVEDIKLKPQNRIGELSLGAKMKGLVTDKSDITSAGKPLITLSSVIATKNGIDETTDNCSG